MSRGLPRYAARRDTGEKAFREEIADAGWMSEPLSKKDWPDLLVAKYGRGLRLVERKWKRPTSEGGRHKVSDEQRAVHRLLLLFGVEVIVCDTSEEFLRAVGDLK